MRLQQRAGLLRRHRDEHCVETRIRRAFAVDLPALAIAHELFDPRPELHAELTGHRLERRIHRGRADPGVIACGGPARGHAGGFPVRNLVDEARFARGEILRAVVEMQRGAAVFHAPSRHPPAGSAALVEQPDLVPQPGEPLAAAHPGHTGTDDRDPHRAARVRHRP